MKNSTKIVINITWDHCTCKHCYVRYVELKLHPHLYVHTKRVKKKKMHLLPLLCLSNNNFSVITIEKKIKTIKVPRQELAKSKKKENLEIIQNSKLTIWGNSA